MIPGRRPRAATALRGLKATVVGLGRFGGGEGAVRFLCAEGAEVTLTDRAGPEALAGPLARLAGLDLRLRLGRQDLRDCAEADLVVLNPAVPPSDPLARALLARGVAVTSEIALFLERCEAPVLGISGSNGKSTTAALTAALLEASGARVHLGGNIGRSLLADLGAIAPSDRVVLELSSAQVKDFRRLGVGVHSAVLTNLTPNHLDYHATYEEYAAAKRQLLETLPEGAWGIVNGGDPAFSLWRGAWRDAAFSLTPPGVPRPGAWLDGGRARLRLGEAALDLPLPETPRLAGSHNRANVLAALCGAAAVWPEAALRPEALAGAIAAFRGLPHRLELVAERGGVRFYNDSKATTPEAASVALTAFPAGTVHAIAGGKSKGMDLSGLAAALRASARAVYLIGQAAGEIRDALGSGGPEVVMAGTLEAAVREASRRAGPGEVVLLSPACASYDQFANYEARGEAFRTAVG